MKKIVLKVRRIITNPLIVYLYLKSRLQKAMLKERVVNEELFYEYKGILYSDKLNHGNRTDFISTTALKYCSGKGIDIGAGKWPLPGAIPIDNNENENAFMLDNFEIHSLDFVYSSHCLEHLKNWKQALTLWISKLKPGGILFLYLPHKSMALWQRGGAWVGIGHEWIPTIEILLPFLSSLNMEVIEYNDDKDENWSFHICGKKNY